LNNKYFNIFQIPDATKPKVVAASAPGTPPSTVLLAKKPLQPSVTQTVVVTPSGICDSTEAGKVIVTASSEGKPAEHQVVAQTTVGSAVVTTAPSSSALVVSQSVYASPASNGSPTPSAVPVDANWWSRRSCTGSTCPIARRRESFPWSITCNSLV